MAQTRAEAITIFLDNPELFKTITKELAIIKTYQQELLRLWDPTDNVHTIIQDFSHRAWLLKPFIKAQQFEYIKDTLNTSPMAQELLVDWYLFLPIIKEIIGNTCIECAKELTRIQLPYDITQKSFLAAFKCFFSAIKAHYSLSRFMVLLAKSFIKGCNIPRGFIQQTKRAFWYHIPVSHAYTDDQKISPFSRILIEPHKEFSLKDSARWLKAVTGSQTLGYICTACGIIAKDIQTYKYYAHIINSRVKTVRNIKLLKKHLDACTHIIQAIYAIQNLTNNIPYLKSLWEENKHACHTIYTHINTKKIPETTMLLHGPIIAREYQLLKSKDALLSLLAIINEINALTVFAASSLAPSCTP